HPILWIAIILGMHLRPVNVNDRAHLRFVRFRSVQIVIDRQEMLLWQLVRPLDQQRLSASRLDRCAGYGRRTRPPARGVHVAMYFDVRLTYGHAVVGHRETLVPGTRALSLCLRNSRNG